jgi:hypothetical protein
MNTYITIIITSLVSSIVTLAATKIKLHTKRLYTRYKPKSLQERVREEVSKQLKEIIND